MSGNGDETLNFGSREILKKYCVYGIFVCGLFLYALVHFHRNSIPGQLYNEISTYFRLDATQMASIGASLMYVYAFMQFANGMLVDKFGGFRVLLCGGMFTVAGSWLFVFSGNYWQLILSRVLTGVGIGATYLSMLDITKSSFPKNFSIMTGFFLCVGQVGGAVGTAPFAALCQACGWLACLKVIAGITTVFVLFFMVCFCIVEKPPVSRKPMRIGNYLTVLFNRNNILNNFSFNFAYGLFYGFFSLIMKKFLQDNYGMSSEGASGVTCAMLIMQAVFNQTFGILVAKFNSFGKQLFNWILVVPFCSCVSVLLLSLWGSSSCKPIVICLFVLMGMIAGCTPVSLDVTRNINPTEISSTAIGFNNSMAYVFSGIFASMTGAILGYFSEGNAFAKTYPPKAYMVLLAINSVLFLIPPIVARFIPDYKGKNIYQHSFQIFGIGKR